MAIGRLQIYRFRSKKNLKELLSSLEKYSNHPIAKSISDEWKIKDEIRWKKIEEVKGLGMKAEDKEGNDYWAGSFKIAKEFTKDDNHNIYILKNDQLIGWIDVKDEIRPEAKSVIDYLHSKKYKNHFTER